MGGDRRTQRSTALHEDRRLDLAHAGTTGHREVLAYQEALDAFAIPYEVLGIDDLRGRYPQWRLDDDVVALFQEDGGLLDIRKSVSAHTALALAAGVEFRPHTPVTGIDLKRGAVAVTTPNGTLHAGRLVVAAGSWLPDLLADLGLDFRLTLSQEQVCYFASSALSAFTPDRFPVWIYHGEQAGDLYGFPVHGEAAVKLGRDMRGHFIESHERRFDGDDDEPALLHGFLERHLPEAAGPLLTSKTCVYDMPSDRNFVLDTIPDHPHVAVFSGGGHAGKFASLVGKILAEVSMTGRTDHPIAPFSLHRPAITDPEFPAVFTIAHRFA